VAEREICEALAQRLRASRDTLVERWLERIAARVALRPNDIFPTQELLNHVPLLIDGVADFIERHDAAIAGNAVVIAKARELGALRHGQGFDAYEILKEHEILNAILFSFSEEVIEEVAPDASPVVVVRVLRRLSDALEIIREATAVHYLELTAARVSEREDRLRRFNRMVAHELKNHLSAIRGASDLLPEPWLDDAQRARFVEMVRSNTRELQHVLDNLESLSRMDSDARQNRNVMLPEAAREVARRLREQAHAHGVGIRIAPSLPAVEVHAAAVELALTNYISNAIKYADPAKSQRWVEIDGTFHPLEAAGGGGELVVHVRDNGIGVPPQQREHLFQRFFRAQDDTVTAEGSGLGLSIVRETMESLGGHAWAEFPDDGTTRFVFSLPSRREHDAAAAGVTRDSAP
jgi:signal transduction histidine kinase